MDNHYDKVRQVSIVSDIIDRHILHEYSYALHVIRTHAPLDYRIGVVSLSSCFLQTLIHIFTARKAVSFSKIRRSLVARPPPKKPSQAPNGHLVPSKTMFTTSNNTTKVYMARSEVNTLAYQYVRMCRTAFLDRITDTLHEVYSHRREQGGSDGDGRIDVIRIEDACDVSKGSSAIYKSIFDNQCGVIEKYSNDKVKMAASVKSTKTVSLFIMMIYKSGMRYRMLMNSFFQDLVKMTAIDERECEEYQRYLEVLNDEKKYLEDEMPFQSYTKKGTNHHFGDSEIVEYDSARKEFNYSQHIGRYGNSNGKLYNVDNSDALNYNTGSLDHISKIEQLEVLNIELRNEIHNNNTIIQEMKDRKSIR